MRIAALLLLAACYHAAPANRDVAMAWRGRTAAELTDRWGNARQQQGDALVWSYSTEQIELPSARVDVHPVVPQGFPPPKVRSRFALAVDPRPSVAAVAHVDGPGVSGTAVAAAAIPTVAVSPGEILRTRHDAAAFVQNGIVADVQGEALHWGPPNDVNLHWGTIFGAHAGMGRLGNTGTPLPSGELYIGGMLTPHLGLVGTYTFVAGSGDAGGAIGMAGGVAVQYWPVNRLWVRAGPAMLLAWDPGFDNGRLEPGVTAAASYAFVKVGTLAIDLCLDVAGGPQTAFGTLGVGVNLN